MWYFLAEMISIVGVAHTLILNYQLSILNYLSIKQIDKLEFNDALKKRSPGQPGDRCLTIYFSSRNFSISWIKLRTSWNRRYTEANRI